MAPLVRFALGGVLVMVATTHLRGGEGAAIARFGSPFSAAERAGSEATDPRATLVIDYAQIHSAICEMGQDLFEPPEVKDWRYEREWISLQRPHLRYQHS